MWHIQAYIPPKLGNKTALIVSILGVLLLDLRLPSPHLGKQYHAGFILFPYMPLSYYYIWMYTEGISCIVLEVWELYTMVTNSKYFSAVCLYCRVYFYMKYGSTLFIFMLCHCVWYECTAIQKHILSLMDICIVSILKTVIRLQWIFFKLLVQICRGFLKYYMDLTRCGLVLTG